MGKGGIGAKIQIPHSILKSTHPVAVFFNMHTLGKILHLGAVKKPCGYRE